MSYTQYYKQEKYVNGSPTGEYRRGDATGEVFDDYEDCTTNTHYRWITVEGDYYCDGHDKYAKQKQQKSVNGGAWTDTGTFRHGDLIERDSDDCQSKMYRWKDTKDIICDGDFLCYKAVYQQSTDGGETWTNVEPLEYGIGQGIEAHSNICTSSNGSLWQVLGTVLSSGPYPPTSPNYRSLTVTRYYDDTNPVTVNGSVYYPYTAYYNGTPLNSKPTMNMVYRVGYMELDDGITSIPDWFNGPQLRYGDATGWDTSRVQLTAIFAGQYVKECDYKTTRWATNSQTLTLRANQPSLEKLDMSGIVIINPQNVYRLTQSFRNSPNLKEILWPAYTYFTGANDLSYVFESCRSLESIDLSNIASNNAESITGMFANCISLRNIDMTPIVFTAPDDGSGFIGVFGYCYALETIDLGYCTLKENTMVTGLQANATPRNPFYRCDSLREIKLHGANITTVNKIHEALEEYGLSSQVSVINII